MAEDVIKEFLIDCYENLDRLDLELVELEKDPHDSKRLASAFRTIHTIKGASGFLAFTRLEAVTHVGEHLLAKMRDGVLVLDKDVATALLQMVDAVREILSHIEQHQHEPDVDYAEVIAVLQEASGRSTDAVTAPAPPAPPATPAPIAPVAPPPPAAESVVVKAEEPPAAPAADPVAAPEEEHDRRSGDDRRSSDDRRGAVSDSALRIDVGLLDKLMNLVGELVLARNQILQFTATQSDGTLASATQRLDLVTSELQEGVMKTRMQPIGNIWSKFPRVVRDVATHCGKDVRIEMEGKETDLDKTIIEAIKDPLTHIVRNSVDHGVESPAVRIARGKPPQGLIKLRASHEGGQINIEVSDDGAGIDPEKIRTVALRRGVLTPDQASRMSDHEVIRLVFAAGFSTAEKVSNISGRGVGMDVVRTHIERIGGQVDIQSRVGEGTVLKIKIPLTLAIIPALIVSAAAVAERYAIPQVSLLELVRLEGEQARSGIERIQGAMFYRLRGNLLPLISLDRELGGDEELRTDLVNIVVLKADDRQFGLVVSSISDTEEIVVKPLSKQLKGLNVFAGATIMGDGRVALILDVLALAQRAGVVSEVKDRSLSEVEGRAAEGALESDGQTLLVFRAGRHTRMALPLSLVARLEEFPASSIERMGARNVVQYRGDILPVVALWSDELAPVDSTQSVQAIVFNHEGRHLAVAVDEILDIVTERVVVDRALASPGMLGSAVIQQRVTELVDVGAALAVAQRSCEQEAA